LAQRAAIGGGVQSKKKPGPWSTFEIQDARKPSPKRKKGDGVRLSGGIMDGGRGPINERNVSGKEHVYREKGEFAIEKTGSKEPGTRKTAVLGWLGLRGLKVRLFPFTRENYTPCLRN